VRARGGLPTAHPTPPHPARGGATIVTGSSWPGCDTRRRHLIETVFAWEGMGQLYFKTLSGEPDEAVVIGLTFMFTLIYVAVRLLLEILYVFLDPRVRYQ
jgi:hypothetical protein